MVEGGGALLRGGRLDILKLLIEHGYDVNYKWQAGVMSFPVTMLQMAVQHDTVYDLPQDEVDTKNQFEICKVGAVAGLHKSTYRAVRVAACVLLTSHFVCMNDKHK